MSKYSALIKRASNATAALALTLASLTPAVMLGSTAKAAGQLSARSITMSSSAVSATSVTYTVAFTTDAGNFKSMAIEFCGNSPLLDNATCTAVPGLAVTSAASTGWTVSNPSDDIVRLTRSDAQTGSVTVAITGITNPSSAQTFYARIATYVDEVGSGDAADDYVTGNPGTTRDEGGIALASTNNLTVNAKVQEELKFCVGAVDAANITGSGSAAANGDFANCLDSEFTSAGTVDLGVVGTSAVSSPVSSATDGNDDTGVFLIQTNAVGGAAVTYTSTGALKVTGATCNDSLTDQCFNNASSFTAWDAEKFGMTVSGLYKGSLITGDGTANLVRATAYNGTNYSWNSSPSSAVTIASSTSSTPKVLDWEFGILEFKALAAATTPTGTYSTTANFVATSTF